MAENPAAEYSDLQNAVEVLRRGGIVAYPAEAVWGLGCDPCNRQSVQQLLQLKKRSPDLGLILVAADIEQFRPLLGNLTRSQLNTLQMSWPGPETWLIPDPHEVAPGWIRGRHHSVALRVTAHRQTADLCRAFGGPLVSTSANRHGQLPARNARQTEKYFGSSIDFLLPGEVGSAVTPTRIRELLSGREIRSA